MLAKLSESYSNSEVEKKVGGVCKGSSLIKDSGDNTCTKKELVGSAKFNSCRKEEFVRSVKSNISILLRCWEQSKIQKGVLQKGEISKLRLSVVEMKVYRGVINGGNHNNKKWKLEEIVQSEISMLSKYFGELKQFLDERNYNCIGFKLYFGVVFMFIGFLPTKYCIELDWSYLAFQNWYLFLLSSLSCNILFI